MMNSDYSIANALTPTKMIATVPSSVMRPTATPSQQVVVIPRSTTETLGGIPSFLTPTVANFASLAGSNPIPNQFALASMTPTSATSLADGTPLYTDPTVFNALNTRGVPFANNSSLFASSTQPQGTNLSTFGGLGGNIISAVPSLASPRSLGAIPTVNSSSSLSTADVVNLFDSKLPAKTENDKPTASSRNGSTDELLTIIQEVKAEVKQELKAGKHKTLVSASPRSAAAEK